MKMYFAIAAMAVTGIVLSCKQQKTKANDLAEMNITSAEKDGSTDHLWSLNKDEEREKQDEQSPKQKPYVQQAPPPVPADWDKRIIKNAELHIRVKDLKQATAIIQQAITSSGGYIASASEVQLSQQLKSEMLIRVPREKFDDLLNRLSGYADSISTKKITSEDVTDEYIDTKARVQVKEKTRDQYFEFLKRAKNIDEVLKVQNEITSLQEDIEAATGRMNYIQHQSALSSIYFTFYQDLPFINTPVNSPGFGVQFVNSIKTGWDSIQSFVLVLVTIWPLLLLASGIWIFVKRRKLKLIPQTK